MKNRKSNPGVAIMFSLGITLSNSSNLAAHAQEKEVTLDGKNYYSMIRSNSEKSWSLSSLTRLGRLNAERDKGEKFKRISYLASIGNNTLACQDVGNVSGSYFDCISDNNAFGFAINSYVFLDRQTKRAFVVVGKNASEPCTGAADIYVVDASSGGLVIPDTKYWKKPLEADGSLQVFANKFGFIFGCFDGFPPDQPYKYTATSSPSHNLNIRSDMPWDTIKKYTIYSEGW